MTRLARDWRSLSGDQRVAAASAMALFISMFLPWYQQNAVVTALHAAPLQSRNLNAFQVFTFVEAAVLLVALAVLCLLYARAEGREFHLPGSDGSVVMAAGLWTALLLVFRLFDKPGISSHGVAANVGVQWGIFFALASSAAMVYAGSRMRASRHLEPPLLRPRPPAPPPDASTLPTRKQPAPRASRPRHPPAPARRPVAAAKPSQQLSFEDPPPAKD